MLCLCVDGYILELLSYPYHGAYHPRPITLYCINNKKQASLTWGPLLCCCSLSSLDCWKAVYAGYVYLVCPVVGTAAAIYAPSFNKVMYLEKSKWTTIMYLAGYAGHRSFL